MVNKTQIAGVHGIVIGGFRLIQGGRFEHGFMAGFFSSFVIPSNHWTKSMAVFPEPRHEFDQSEYCAY